MNTYLVTYTVKGYMTAFKDVVECESSDDCADEVRKLVLKYVGPRSFRIILIQTV